MATGTKGYISKHPGRLFDEAIDYYLRARSIGPNRIIESSPENKVNLNSLTTEEGTFIIEYYTNSYNDNDTTEIVILVAFPDENTVLQKYSYHGTEIERRYDRTTEVWTLWADATATGFILAAEDETVEVSKPTMVLREITGNVDELFGSSESEEETEP